MKNKKSERARINIVSSICLFILSLIGCILLLISKMFPMGGVLFCAVFSIFAFLSTIYLIHRKKTSYWQKTFGGYMGVLLSALVGSLLEYIRSVITSNANNTDNNRYLLAIGLFLICLSIMWLVYVFSNNVTNKESETETEKNEE